MARYTKSEKLGLMIRFKANYTNQPYWRISAMIDKTLRESSIRVNRDTFYRWRREMFKTIQSWNRFLFKSE